MTPEQWQTLQDLFEEVIQEPLDRRGGALERLESNIQDSAIRRELRRLVEHAEVGAEFLSPVAGKGIHFDLGALRPGEVVADRFDILQPLGKGGMAEVFEAFDRKLGERVAIKIIAPEFARDSSLLARFQQEVQIARRITHPNICRIHDLGEHQGQPYLSMEFLEGETLAKRLERGPLPLEMWHECARQLFLGLHAAHAAGVIHRDLKTSNLMLCGSRWVILDFGLARPILAQEDGGLTQAGTLVGTLDWMAPEQLRGEYDERSDLYSAALILLRALKQGTDATGSGGLVGALRRATTDTEFREQLPKSLPAAWQYAIMRCLERDPLRRPRSVEEVQNLVQTRRLLPVSLPRFAQSHWKTITIVLAVLALFIAGIRFLRYPKEEQTASGLKPGAAIMVAATANATNDSRFDGITALLRADFRQSPRFNLWDDAQRLAPALLAMRLDPGVKPDPKQWREMAVRENVPLLVFSTLSPLGDFYRFSIHGELLGSDPTSPVKTWEFTEDARGPEELFEKIHIAANSLRIAAGETTAERMSNNRLPQDITSSNWEALEAFAHAQALSDQQRSDEAVPWLRRAVELDGNFAMALMRLGDILNSQDKVEEGFSYWRRAKASAAAQHLSLHERLSIDGRYAMEIKDFDQAELALRDWKSKFPNDPLPAHFLVFCLLQKENYEEAIRVARDNQERFPPSDFGTSLLIRALLAKPELRDIDQQITTFENLSSRPVALQFRAAAAALGDDYDGAARFLQEVTLSDNMMEASRATTELANLEADRGDFVAARKLLTEGIRKDLGAGRDGFAAQKSIALAYLDAIEGNPARAVAQAKEAVRIRRSPVVVVQAVAIAARHGAPQDAETLMRAFPFGEGPKYEGDLHRMTGEILAARRNFKGALENLTQASKAERPNEPKEYLARALDLAGDRAGALLEYQKIAAVPLMTWLSENQFPAPRWLAKQYLKSLKGEKQ